MFIDTEDKPTAPTGDPNLVASDGALVLECQDAEGTRRIPIIEGHVRSVGSSRSAWLRVHDPAVSARHCEFTLQEGVLRVRDVGSRNGTFAGAARIQEARCSIGTILTLGSSSIAVQPFAEEESGDPSAEPLPGLVGGSSTMRRLAAQVRRLARHSAAVLICGETGTGKELIAKALHHEGPRRTQPYVTLNVTSLPRELVESELFGHERGAFTGAVGRKVGAFEEAGNGTLFLDEIGELPLESQPKLLRALDGYDVRRVGGGKVRQEARVVTATHVPLEHAVHAGLFRRDLFHRLEVFVIRVPPLRARPTDIGPIAKSILRQCAQDIGAKSLTGRAVAYVTDHPWPGNVRELRNTLLRAADLARDSAWIDVPHLMHAAPRATAERITLTSSLAKELLANHGNNVSAAARASGYPRTSFRKLLK